MHAQHIRMKTHIPCETQRERERETDRQTERERVTQICKNMPSGHKCMRKTPAESHRDMYMDCVMQKINQRSLIRTIAVRLKGHLTLQTILINNKGPSHMQMVWLSYLGKSTEYTFSCGTAIMYQWAKPSWQHSFLEIDHEIFSTVYHYLPLI